jgi:hypothetical protein
MHNSIPEYAMWLSHSILFRLKKIFEECFSPRLSLKSPSHQRDGALKKIERKRKNIEKRGRKKESSKSLCK